MAPDGGTLIFVNIDRMIGIKPTFKPLALRMNPVSNNTSVLRGLLVPAKYVLVFSALFACESPPWIILALLLNDVPHVLIKSQLLQSFRSSVIAAVAMTPLDMGAVSMEESTGGLHAHWQCEHTYEQVTVQIWKGCRRLQEYCFSSVMVFLCIRKPNNGSTLHVLLLILQNAFSFTRNSWVLTIKSVVGMWSLTVPLTFNLGFQLRSQAHRNEVWHKH